MNCKQEYPLNKDYYQPVSYFKTKFSYYCNTCDITTKKVKSTENK